MCAEGVEGGVEGGRIDWAYKGTQEVEDVGREEQELGGGGESADGGVVQEVIGCCEGLRETG